MHVKVGRNEPCPCGSGKKFKRCCAGIVDWDRLLDGPLPEAARHMRIRAKNLHFVGLILSALQIDSWKRVPSFVEFKGAFTPTVVSRIYSAVDTLWPDLDDYVTSLRREQASVTALYTGHYQPEAIFRAISRHALYSDHIYLVDPFFSPKDVRPEFNPLMHPEEHIVNAIQFSFLWLTLVPWIDAGLVSFIRPLPDFVPGLFQELLEIQREKIDANPDLSTALNEQVQDEMAAISATDRGLTEFFLLSHPDEYFREMYHKIFKDSPFKSEDDLLAYIRHRRDTHPYYVDLGPGRRAQLIQSTSGAHYELAKRICAITNSHLITDMKSRWKEIEHDRAEAGIDAQQWSPFAKALQNADLKVLNHVPLEACLLLRKEDRLEQMRLFFRKVWMQCREPDTFSVANAVALAAELKEKVAEAQDQWRKIDQDLVKLIAPGAVAAAVCAATAGFLPAAGVATITGGVGLINSVLQRNAFKDRFPAGFFLGLKDTK